MQKIKVLIDKDTIRLNPFWPMRTMAKSLGTTISFKGVAEGIKEGEPFPPKLEDLTNPIITDICIDNNIKTYSMKMFRKYQFSYKPWQYICTECEREIEDGELLDVEVGEYESIDICPDCYSRIDYDYEEMSDDECDKYLEAKEVI